MLRKISALVCAGAIASGMMSGTYAAENAEVYFNGEKQSFTVNAEEIDGTVFVPIRPVFELFNYKIEWDGMRKRIRTTTAIGKLTIQIGSVLVSQNDYQAYVISAYPRLLDGTTMIPIDFASAATESSIQFTENNNSIVINSL